ncbi:hypothetical protein CDEST_01279 [Colletotrichum destructivum]|uniref:Rhodopsin domain-containing protein n=1 Tax=Colletotrichum destructivum TaxID=34406 RepID=A0AAX4HZ98_9PEZI|nr:hypothetical protein CDEST_01279 [Colletotrichum destructivum]
MSNTTLPPDTFGSTRSGSLPDDTRRPLIIGVASTLTGIVAVFLAIRVYIRGYLLRAWGLDDSMLVWSCVSPSHCSEWCSSEPSVTSTHLPFYASKVSQFTYALSDAIYGCLGEHVWNLTPAQLKNDSHFMVPSVLMYQITFACVKAAFLLQYRRAFALPHIKTFCDVFLAVTFVIMSSTLIASGLILRVFLQPYYVPVPTETGFLKFSYANAAINLVTDIIIFMIPLALVRRIPLETTQKIGLVASFSVGIFTSAISILRISSLSTSINTIDIKYKAVPLVLLSLAEPTSGIVCACVPLLRPLLFRQGASFSGTNGSSRPLSGDTGSCGGSRDLSTIKPPHSPTSPEIPR